MFSRYKAKNKMHRYFSVRHGLRAECDEIVIDHENEKKKNVKFNDINLLPIVEGAEKALN